MSLKRLTNSRQNDALNPNVDRYYSSKGSMLPLTGVERTEKTNSDSSNESQWRKDAAALGLDQGLPSQEKQQKPPSTSFLPGFGMGMSATKKQTKGNPVVDRYYDTGRKRTPGFGMGMSATKKQTKGNPVVDRYYDTGRKRTWST
eukprot:CAMPEP_0171993968 /NCGR_PEP_ID=MMETSP0993-20121228/278718_1 /TAXON_ID=483369 /ORGANISM="non described non described, Strain CCMP2098" /LENGTH=144 /DNA_ID=CAMNT_0012647037 /DNA_START=70 /DNA_END=504 /DNA_ORIENTATION=+